MAYQVFPSYAPPVDSTKIRRMWSRGVGIFGRLSGFQITEDPQNGLPRMAKGSFISNSCVVDVDEADLVFEFGIPQPVYIYGVFDPKTGVASIQQSSSPLEEWALLAYKWADEWRVPSDATTYSLWANSDSHTGNAELHITSEQKAALILEPDASPNNPFLTESDTTVGMIYSTADMALAAMGSSVNNESQISIDAIGDSIMYDSAGSYMASGGANGPTGGFDSAAFCVEADGRWFEDTFRDPLATWEGLHNLAEISESIASPISGGSRKMSIMESSVESVISTREIERFENESVLGLKVPTLMMFIDSEVEYVKIVSHEDGFDDSETIVENPEIGKWISLSLNLSPEKSPWVIGAYVAIKGPAGTTFRVTPLFRAPVIKFKTNFVGVSSNVTSLRVSPLTSIPNDRYPIKYYVGMELDDPIDISPFFNHSPIAIEEDQDFFSVEAVLSNTGGLYNRIAAEWPDSRVDYCMSDSSVTGCSIVMGGRDGSIIRNTAIAYSPSGDTMTTIMDNSRMKASKSASAEFCGETFICGGEVVDNVIQASSKMYNVASGTIQARTDMPIGKKEFGGCSVSPDNALFWGGSENNNVYRYNRHSDTWTQMPSIVNVSGLRGGAYFEGAIYNQRTPRTQAEIDSDGYFGVHSSQGSIVIGSGETPGSTGSKIDMATFTFISLGKENLVTGSNVACLKSGVAIFQSEDGLGKRSGCMDILSGTERNVLVPTTGIGSSGNSMHSDGRISYGPFQDLEGYSKVHNLYSYANPSWLNGLALKWEDDNS